MKWAREVWVRQHFGRMCKQFQVETAVNLSRALRVCMEQDDSVVHIGFNFGVSRPYYGMVHNREPRQRWQELKHWRAVLQHGSGMATEKELNCSYMALHGNAARWHFLPYISCGQDQPCDCSAEAENSQAGGCSHQAVPKFSESIEAPYRALCTSVADGKRQPHLHDKKTGDMNTGKRDNDSSVHNVIKVWGPLWACRCGADGSPLQCQREKAALINA